LRNRLQNEQKRQEDYIAGLKGQAERWEREAEEAGRERRRLQEELGRVYGVCDGFRAEVRGLTAEVDLLQREKKQWQVSEIMKMRDPAVRKELEVLAQQEKYLREVEGLVEAERQEKLNLEQLNQQLQASLARWDSERLALESEKARLTDLLELREEETSQLRKQLLHDAQSLSRSQQSSHELQAALSLAT
jgi:chromosome segregation ATPase